MGWNPFRRQRPESSATSRPVPSEAEAFDVIDNLLSLQTMNETPLPEIFSELMTNRLAAGYVFGFFDAALQSLGLVTHVDPAAGMETLKRGYRHSFGDQPGFTLHSFSLHFQNDHDFMIGRRSGGEDFIDFRRHKAQPLGLSRIMILGFSADAVERTLHK